MVLDLIPLAKSLARGDEDSFQDCMEAALRAKRSFDPAKGKWKTYAYKWMYHASRRKQFMSSSEQELAVEHHIIEPPEQFVLDCMEFGISEMSRRLGVSRYKTKQRLDKTIENLRQQFLS